MSLPLWGGLEKAQDNNQTIAQAIAIAIAEHNADPVSHTNTGQSLDLHKKENIIDHPQGSILGDKYTNREFTLTPDFSSFDAGYVFSASGINRSLGGLRFETGGTINTVRNVSASGQYSPSYFKETLETTFQVTAQAIDTTNYLAYAVAGSEGITDIGPGIGFKFLNNAVYAVEIYEDVSLGTTEIATLITGASASVKSIYRVHLDTDGTLKYYRDGDLVHTASAHASVDYSLRLFSLYLKNSEAVNKRIVFAGVYISIAIN